MILLHRVAHIAAAALSRKVEHSPSSNQNLMLPHEHDFEPAADIAVKRAAGAPPIVCIFCLRDDASLNTVIDANETFYARLDNFPATPGHVEIVPKRHVESFFDLTESEIIDAYTLMQTVEKELSACTAQVATPLVSMREQWPAGVLIICTYI